MSNARPFRLALAALAPLMALASSGAVSAVSFTVDSTVDAVDANPGDGLCATAAGECTLRAAIQETNALTGPDAVDLPAGTYTLTIFGGFDNEAASGDLDVNDELEIRGAGADQAFIDGGSFGFGGNFIGGPNFEIRAATAVISNLRIMNGGNNLTLGGAILNNGGTLTLNDVVVTHNSAYRGGGIANLNLSTLTVNRGAFIENGAAGSQSAAGAISNQGTMTLDGVTFRGNGSGLGGGAIGNFNTATLNNLTIADNAANTGGGGIYNGFNMTVTNSTLTGNVASAVFNDSTGNLRISNTTISGNSGVGSGIWNFGGSGSLTDVTISGNRTSSSVGGGIYNGIFGLGELVLKNTILSDNSGGNCVGPVAVVSGGHNLSSDGTCPFTVPGDVQSTDPLLGPLAYNGGPTQTQALLPGSPAIDAGDNGACPATDQRGITRPADGNADGVPVCDIGAYELQLQSCAGDVNGDRAVDALDVRLVARSMHARRGSTRWNEAADVNGDGVIDVADLRAVLRARKAGGCR